MTETWTSILPRDTCKEAAEWCKTQLSLEVAWQNCTRGDWMLWLAGKWSGEPGGDGRKPLVLAACACARLGLKYMPAVSEAISLSLHAIETAEAWARGDNGVTLAMVRAAATDSAAYSIYSVYSAYSAYSAAAHSVYTAAAYAYAAYAAAYSAYSSDAAAYASACIKLAECAEIVRRFYAVPPKALK